MFGLGNWLVERYRQQWLLGMSAPWALLRRTDQTVLRLSFVVLAAFAGACAYLAHAGYRHQITLGTLAVMLPMLAATTPFGDISWDDVALSWMMEGLPRAGRLEQSLRSRRAELSGEQPAAGLPRREVRFEGVCFGYPASERLVRRREAHALRVVDEGGDLLSHHLAQAPGEGGGVAHVPRHRPAAGRAQREDPLVEPSDEWRRRVRRRGVVEAQSGHRLRGWRCRRSGTQCRASPDHRAGG